MPEEKIFTIPLRDVFEDQRTDRTKRAMNLVKGYLVRHMKTENVKIGDSINKELWKRGIQKPPRKVRIHVLKEGDVAYAELMGVDIKTPSKEEEKAKKKKKEEKKEKIREERKERKKMTIQEEMEKESGKSPEKPVISEEKPEKLEKEEKPKEEK